MLIGLCEYLERDFGFVFVLEGNKEVESEGCLVVWKTVFEFF